MPVQGQLLTTKATRTLTSLQLPRQPQASPRVLRHLQTKATEAEPALEGWARLPMQGWLPARKQSRARSAEIHAAVARAVPPVAGVTPPKVRGA